MTVRLETIPWTDTDEEAAIKRQIATIAEGHRLAFEDETRDLVAMLVELAKLRPPLRFVVIPEEER